MIIVLCRETIRPKERPGAPPTKSLMSYSSPSTASPFATSFHQVIIINNKKCGVRSNPRLCHTK